MVTTTFSEPVYGSLDVKNSCTADDRRKDIKNTSNNIGYSAGKDAFPFDFIKETER